MQEEINKIERKKIRVQEEKDNPIVLTAYPTASANDKRENFKKRKAREMEEQSQPLLKIIPLGGLEEVGRNMTLFEYQNQILIVDMGLQFPDEDMPGIDFIIPNIEYLKTEGKKILGVFITHGHYDHLGAIPYLIHKLNYPRIFTAPLTRGIILKRQMDFPGLKSLDITTIDKNRNQPINLGLLKLLLFI